MNTHECGYLCDSGEQDVVTFLPDFGRRIYIHKSSFDAVAAEGRSTAAQIYRALSGVVVAKLAYHDLVLEGGPREAAAGVPVRDLGHRLAKQWQEPLTMALQELAHQDIHAPSRVAHWVPVLSRNERIAATCLDSNYYTFATTDDAARRMYADVEKMSDVWKGVREGRAPYRDLTLLKGGMLRTLGSRDLAYSTRLNEAQLRDIKEEVATQVESELKAVAAEVWPDFSDAERACFDTFVRKSLSIVSRTALSLVPARALA